MKKTSACLINRVISDRRRLALLSTIISSVLSFPAFGQPELLKDVNTEFDMSFTAYSSLRSTPIQLFYLDGTSLWVSKGSASNTMKLKGFDRIDALTVVGTMAYFAADDGAGSGTELWKSNGTVKGTVRIKDIFPGTRSSDPTYITAVNSTSIFFSARNGSNGRELWKTNGTAEGTVMVKDIYPVTGSSSPAFITKVNNLAFFSANNGRDGIELWKSDGTPSGTVMVKNIYPGLKLGSRPQLLAEVNGKLFFKADNGVSGFELYTSNGTAAGTFMVKDIRPGATGGDVENLVKVNGRLLFTANDGVHGDELWRSNGTASGTVLVKDLNPGGAGSNSTSSWRTAEPMGNFATMSGVLFFTAGKGEEEKFIVRSDGTAEGTYRVTDLEPVGLNDLQPCFTYLNGRVYYFNQLDRNDYHLFHMDLNGQNITPLHEYLTPEDYYANFTQEMVAMGDALYLTALRTDGWNLVKQLENGKTEILASGVGPTAGSEPEEFVKAGNLLYFPAAVGAAAWRELWRTDGTQGGTLRIADLSINGYEILAVGTRLFFSSGDELYVTSGTPETTTLLIDFNSLGHIYGLTNVNGMVYFHDYTQDLWRTDGTVAGTKKVRTFQNIVSVTDVGGKAFVLNLTSTGGLELWRTTATGMARIKVVRTGNAINSAHAPTAAIGNIFYFVANDGVHGNEVWRSDGTASGTMMITDMNTVDPVDYYGNEDDISFFAVFNNKLYFSGMDRANQWQFMMVTGQNSVAPIAAMPPVYYSINYNEKLYLFTPSDTDYSHKLWMTDGTVTTGATYLSSLPYGVNDEAFVSGNLYFSARGTGGLMQITDCGALPVDIGYWNVFPIEGLGDDLVFAGFYNGGIEPLIYRNIAAISNTCPDAVLMNTEVRDNAISPWPNPYTTDFSLRIEGAEGETADVVIFDAGGFPIEEWNGLSTNTDYRGLGVTWAKGIYLIKVNRGNSIIYRRLIRK